MGRREELLPVYRNTVSITTVRRRECSGEMIAVTDTDVTVRLLDKPVKLQKDQIAKVDMISYTPLSDKLDRWGEECDGNPLVCPMNPALWPRMLGLGLKVRVRLFDSTLPEDNAPVVCK